MKYLAAIMIIVTLAMAGCGLPDKAISGGKTTIDMNKTDIARDEARNSHRVLIEIVPPGTSLPAMPSPALESENKKGGK